MRSCLAVWPEETKSLGETSLSLETCPLDDFLVICNISQGTVDARPYAS